MKLPAPQNKGLFMGLRLLSAISLLISAPAIFAESGGINGVSGQFANCTSCHDNVGTLWTANPVLTDNDVNVTTDPDNALIFLVTPGSTGNSFLIDATSANSVRVGVNLSVTGGTLVDTSGIGHLEFGEFTHDSPQTPPAASWSIDWDAPAEVGTYTFYWCNNLVDNNGTNSSAVVAGNRDNPVCRTKQIKVNTDPNANDDTINTVNEDSSNNCLTILSNDTSGTSGNETSDSITLFSVGVPSSGSAAIGGGSCTTSQIRYTPTANFDGTATVTYTIRDSFNQAGFADTATVTINIVDSNDVPTISGVNAANSYTENAPGTIIDSTITVDDVDNTFCNQAIIDISTGYQNGQDILEYGGAIAGVTAGAFNAPTGSITLSASNGTVTCANFANAMEAVTFRNTSDNPVAGARTITFQVRDDSNGSSTGVFTNGVNSTTVSVTAVNDAPVITEGASVGVTMDEDNSPMAFGLTLNATDVDSGTLTWSISSQGTNGGTATASGNGASKTIGYTPPSADYNGSDSFVVQVSDGGVGGTDTITVNVTINAVNDAPVISGLNNAPTYNEAGPAVTIDSSITVADPDSTCTQATIDLSTNYQSAEDELQYAGSVPGISAGAFNSGTGTLTLTGAVACSDYGTALSNVRYLNNSLDPDTNQRTVVFQVTDASGGVLSNAPTTTITVSSASTAPTVSDVDNVATYSENGAAVVIDPTITLTDPDSADLNRATVTITPATYNAAQDQLVYSPVLHGVTVFSNSGGVLTLTGVATKAQYEEVLESVRYQNTSNNPSVSGTNARVIEFSVRDNPSNVSTITPDSTTLNISVTNDAPVIDVDNSSAANYTENAVLGAIVDSTITITDAESDSITGGTVSITANFNSSEDRLIYSTINGITGLYDIPSGVLTLTGTATLAQYEQALESVRYLNNSENPVTAARTISFAVTDNGTNDGTPAPLTSIADTANVGITAVNDAPVISAVDNIANYTENTAAVVIDSSVTIGDVDSTQLNQATISITGNFAGVEDLLSYGGAVPAITVQSYAGGILTLTGTATLAEYEQALETVTYQNTSDAPSTAVRTISIVVQDAGNVSSAADTTSLMVTATNDTPNAVDDNYAVPVDSSNNELNVLANDTDVDPGDTQAITAVGTPNNGGTVVIGAPCAANTLCYTPPPGFTGINVFTYTLQDSAAAQDTATVTVSGTDSDSDGIIDFLDNCPSDSNGGQQNNDGDGQGDVCDDDDDNDGMADTFEATHSAACGLDPFDPADAAEDCDGDGLSNVGEEDAGSNPTLDDVDPVFSGVQDITVNATGYLTPVNLGTIAAVDGADGAVAVTVVSVVNVTGSTLRSEAVAGLFRPGRTQINRSATDSQGNVANSTQTIDVRPLADFMPDQVRAEDNTNPARIWVFLNGVAPDPVADVTVDYTVSGTSGIGPDYTLNVNGTPTVAVSGTLIINAGNTEGFIDATLLNDGVADANETLMLTLSSPVNAALGSKTTHTLTIAEGNVAPRSVSLSLLQTTAGIFGGSEIYADQDVFSLNDVQLSSSVDDPGDTFTYAWTTTLGSSFTDTLTFSSNGLAPGLYPVTLRVTDSGGASLSTQIFIAVRAASAIPSLLAGNDMDSDGSDDDVEGFGDMDSDGIPNYLDAYELASDTHVIQNQTGDLQNVKLIQTDQGYILRKGPVALFSDVSGIMVSESNVMNYAGANNIPMSSANDNMANVGGIYDFEIYNVQPGTTARVVLPLSARILEGSVYRKFSLRNGWRDFITDGNNAIATTRGTNGVCPAPGHASYRGGLNVFDDCLQLTLRDGGPNDADGAANGIIRDPGGVAVVEPAPAPVQSRPRDGGGGGILHPFWLLLMLWGALRRRAKNEISLDSSASRVLD